MPRFAVLVKPPAADYEAGAMPTQSELEEMGAFNEELVAAGAMQAGEGLHPTAKGALVSFADGAPTVVDGPFAEARELVGGFWILELGSLDEAVGWMKRAPFREGEVEIRQIYADDELLAKIEGAA